MGPQLARWASKVRLMASAASWAVDDVAAKGTVFRVVGDDGVPVVLVQTPGEVNGIAGRFEWIIDGGNLTHQTFISRVCATPT